ncbi:MAG: WecB/TagA/CpsF family glycosyltransferase, partial [Acidobacteriota bacterium]
MPGHVIVPGRPGGAATWWRVSPESRAALRQLRRSAADAARRALGATAAVATALALSPCLLGRAVWGRLLTGRWLAADLVLGRRGRPLRRYRFAGEFPGAGLAGLWHVATGDCDWVGPRPVVSGDLPTLTTRDLVRLEVTPGLISLGGVRQRMGLAHDGVARLERAMALDDATPKAGLLARALLASCLGSRTRGDGHRDVHLFGVRIDDRTMACALDEVVDAARRRRRRRIAFVNPDCLNKAFGDRAYRAALRTADRVYADGIGVRWAARWRGRGLRDNVNGTDLFPRLCERAAAQHLSIYLLGARPGVAADAAAAMAERFPGLRIA